MKHIFNKQLNQYQSLTDCRSGGSLTANKPQSRSTLPPGFEWVSLTNIEPDGFLTPDSFSAGQYVELRNHLKSLQCEILPILKSKPEADRDYFRILDNNSDRTNREGNFLETLERTYELFFEAEHIRFCRKPGSKLLGVTNGRHRMSIARDLGWSAIPAKVVGALYFE